VLMGALWKVRERLRISLGDPGGPAAADELMYGWMAAYNVLGIVNKIKNQWLILDDDDGDLTNGTPHYADIAGLLT